jgi:hypothetical protein
LGSDRIDKTIAILTGNLFDAPAETIDSNQQRWKGCTDIPPDAARRPAPGIPSCNTL